MNQQGCPSPVCSALLIIGSGIDSFLGSGHWARKEEKPWRKAFRFGLWTSHRVANRSTIKPLSGGFRLIRREDLSHLRTFRCRLRKRNNRIQWHFIWKRQKAHLLDIGRGWFYVYGLLPNWKKSTVLFLTFHTAQKMQKLRAKPLSIHDAHRITHVGHVGGKEDRERSHLGLLF